MGRSRSRAAGRRQLLRDIAENTLAAMVLIAMFVFLIWWSGTITEMRMAGLW